MSDRSDSADPWVYDIAAFNTATESTNRMHDNAVAAQYGYSGGLVPGVDIWAYATGPCVDRWGRGFLERGLLDLRFESPVYDGEPVTATLLDNGALTVTGPDGGVRARGTALIDDEAPVPIDIAVVDVPDAPPPAEPELLAPGTVLGTLRFTHQAEKHAGYLDAVRETRHIYDGGKICHPGMLARQANYVLSASVGLGPWIHVHTRARHRRVVSAGEEIEVRGVVTDERERSGHRFVTLDVEITAEGEPAWSATHTAIWRPRTRR